MAGFSADLMIIGGGVLTGASLFLASQRASEASSPPPSPTEDVEYPEGVSVDLTPYYIGGFVGAVMFGAGVVLKVRGKNTVRV